MEQLLTFLMYAALGYLVTQIILHLTNRHLERRLQEMQATLEEFRANNVACRVERYGDIFYIYDASTGNFIAQGQTVEEIRAHVEQTGYRNKRIFVSEGEEDVISALERTSTRMEGQHA